MKKRALAVAISSALAAPMAANAIDGTFYGQVNRAVMFADDGEGSGTQFVDNSASGSRIGVQGSQDIGNGVTAGFKLEVQGFANTTSFGQTIKGNDGANAGTLNERQTMVYFSGDWGKVSLGHTDGAGNGTTEADATAQTFLTDENTWSTWGGSIAFRTGSGAAGPTLSQVHSSFDGFSRYDTLRYDTPAFGPVTIAGSVGNNDRYEVGAFMNQPIGGGDLQFNLGYSRSKPQDNTKNQYTGSIAYRFAFGTGITASYGQRDYDSSGRRDGKNLYFKLGQTWGNHAISGSWGKSWNVLRTQSQVQNLAVGYDYTFPKPKVQLYAGYHNYDLRDDGATTANYQDMNVFAVGSRIRF